MRPGHLTLFVALLAIVGTLAPAGVRPLAAAPAAVSRPGTSPRGGSCPVGTHLVRSSGEEGIVDPRHRAVSRRGLHLRARRRAHGRSLRSPRPPGAGEWRGRLRPRRRVRRPYMPHDRGDRTAGRGKVAVNPQMPSTLRRGRPGTRRWSPWPRQPRSRRSRAAGSL